MSVQNTVMVRVNQSETLSSLLLLVNALSFIPLFLSLFLCLLIRLSFLLPNFISHFRTVYLPTGRVSSDDNKSDYSH